MVCLGIKPTAANRRHRQNHRAMAAALLLLKFHRKDKVKRGKIGDNEYLLHSNAFMLNTALGSV